MKRKIGTVMESDVLFEAKKRAAREGKTLAEIIQNALINYMHEEVSCGDALRAYERFCSYGKTLDLHEIDELLQKRVIAI